MKGERLDIDPIPDRYTHEEFHDNHTKHLFLDSITAQQEERHLFSPYGYLDGSWFHRSYWVYGNCFLGGWNGYYLAGKYMPAGRLLVHDRKMFMASAGNSNISVGQYHWNTSCFLYQNH